MKTGIANALDYGMKSGVVHGELNTAALRLAVKGMEVAGGIIFIPSGVYEITGAIRFRASANPRSDARVRIVGEDHPTIVQTTKDPHFELEEPTKDGTAANVTIDGLTLQGKPDATCGDATAAP